MSTLSTGLVVIWNLQSAYLEALEICLKSLVIAGETGNEFLNLRCIKSRVDQFVWVNRDGSRLSEQLWKVWPIVNGEILAQIVWRRVGTEEIPKSTIGYGARMAPKLIFSQEKFSSRRRQIFSQENMFPHT
jgi:hypothetical protein